MWYINSPWWLRSPDSDGLACADYVEVNGVLTSNNVGTSYPGLRPALYLNLISVLFSSSASAGGKSSATAGGGFVGAAATTGAVKFTARDSSRNFAAATTNVNGSTLTIGYTGATVGTNDYVSAVIKDSAGVTHYAKLVKPSAADGTTTLTLPGSFDASTDTVYVFSEQANGDSHTDYASALVEVSLTPPVTATYTYNTPDPITVNGVTATVSFDKAGPQAAGTEVTTIVTLTGTATAAGTHTINLSSTKASLSGTAQNISVTAGQAFSGIAAPNTYSFTVPEQAVDDLTLTHSFTAAAVLKQLWIGSSTPVTLPAAGEYTWGGNAGGEGTTGEALPEDSGTYTWYVHNDDGDCTLTLKGANITTDADVTWPDTYMAYAPIVADGELNIALDGESMIKRDYSSGISCRNGSIRISGGANDKLWSGRIEIYGSGSISISGCTVVVSSPNTSCIKVETGNSISIENATVIATGYCALDKEPVLRYTNGYLWKASTDGTVPAEYTTGGYTYAYTQKYFEIRPAIYTVTFDKQSGTGGTGSVTAKYGDAMPEATMPTRQSYTFTGYFDAATGGTEYYNADGTSARAWDKTADTTLYARWTYNGGGGGYDPDTVYSTIEGAGGTWTQGAAGGYSFTFNALFSRFRSVRVDGATVAASNYDKREGSTIITLHADYLATLSVGTHTMRVIFSDGYAQTTFTIAEAVNPFTDVTESDWFYGDVIYARVNDLMEGTGDTTFDPHGTTIRGMIVTILYRLEKEPTVTGDCPFDDVASGKYYEDAITWAAANKIVDGYGNAKFGPEDPITREQMAAILYRYERYKGGGFTGAWMFPLNFPDANKVSDYAYEAMCWCAMNGIINGNSDGTLAPHGSAQRCHVAAILHRFCDNQGK